MSTQHRALSAVTSATSSALSQVGSVWKRIESNPFTWISLVVFFLVAFRLYPLIEAIRISFTNMGFLQEQYSYVGLESYRQVLSTPGFSKMVGITVIFVSTSVIGQIGLGLILALAVDYGVRKSLPGSVLTRVSVLSAWVIPGIVIGIIWKIMLIGANYGVINYILLQLQLIENALPFLIDPQLALGSVIIANTWRGTAFSMIMLYGGLQQVPRQLYEAAKVDGASAYQRFRHITIPQIKPVLFINLVLITIYTFNTFDMILSLTGGGPGRATQVLSLYMYFEAFSRYNLGNAAALAVMMLGVNIVMTLIYLRYFIDEEEF